MNNPQQLKERIYALNPELKELTEGCRIKIWWLDNPDEREADEEAVFSERSMRDNGGVDGKYKQIIEDNVCGTVEIIGHPIHLEHVLRAIGDIQDRCMFSDGSFSAFNMVTGTWSKYCRYDLTKTFDQNIAENEELVTFLLSIIK